MRISRKWWAFAAGIVAAGSVVIAHRASNYLHDDPTLCVSCHGDSDTPGVGLVDGAARSHPGTTCQACHPLDTSTGLALMRASVTLDAHERVVGDNVVAHGAVSDAACAECHTRTDADWKRTLATAGHTAHVGVDHPRSPERTVTCSDCHASTGHDGRPGNAVCADCHDDTSLASSPMAQVHCMECHEFLAPPEDLGRRPRFARCDNCHGTGADAQAMPVQLHAEMPCSVCHQPHREPFTISQGCEDCHAKVVHAHPQFDPVPGGDPGNAGAAYCTGCHGPHDEWSLASERCAGCHEEQVLAALPAAAGPMYLDDDLMAAIAEQTAHATCVDCHSAHEREGVMVAKNCVDCHEDVRAPRKHVETGCDGCHAPHRPKPRACVDCHDDERVRHGPADCRDCHAVHPSDAPGFGARDTRSCASCHRQPEVLVGHPETNCTACHAPHRPTPRACDTCHEAEVKAVAGRPDEHRDCAGCHPAHGALDDAARANLKTKCRDCHAEPFAVTAKVEAHADCAACHATHTLTAAMPGGCTECHADTLRHTLADHRSCGDCHAPHDGARTGRKGCADCHADQARPPANVPPHTDCDACHAVHPDSAAPPPACASCHDPKQPKGGVAPAPGSLHQMAGHEDCADCHTAHGPPRATRADCLRCHEAQATHEQQAPVCNGCHRFIKEH